MNARSLCAIVMLLMMGLASAAPAAVTQEDFGKTADGKAVTLFTITNKSGASLKLMTYGASVVSLNVPDREGKLGDIVLGYDHLDGYLKVSSYFYAVVGRYGNRIANATFTLDGTAYHLEPNNNGNTLHGGRKGFDKVVWTGSKVDDNTVDFSYLSKDGEGGFPGNLTAHAKYSFSDENVMTIEYSATTDKPTVVNLTNHSFFNLNGAGSGDILSHLLTIDADNFTPGTATLIPTGKIEPVAGTPFDFTKPTRIGDRIDANNDQIRAGHGYDINFVLNKKDGLRLAATAYVPGTGRVMELWTTQPGLQFYSGNGLDGSLIGKEGKVYNRRGAFCLEPQHFPDSPNEPTFPSTVLKPGETYSGTSVYKFSSRAQ